MGSSNRFEGGGPAANNPIASAIAEVLDGHATPEVRDHILERALELAHLTAIPPGGVRVAELLEGLEVAVTEALGVETADAVSEWLEPVLAHLGLSATSGVMRRRRDTPVGEAQRDLLVVSSDRSLAPALAAALLGVRVHEMDDIFALLSAVEAHAGTGLLLLVDGRRQMLRTATIVSLTRVLPPDARVVLWAIDDDVCSSLERASRTVEWVRVSAEADVDELVWLCRIPPAMTGAGGAGDPEVTTPGLRTENLRTENLRTENLRTENVVLLVDDDRTFRQAVGRLLHACGFEILHAQDGDEAIAVARARRPDVILTDQNMPGTSGLELAEALRLTLGPKMPPIALVTATNVDDLDTKCVQRVVQKPVPGDQLVALVEELLGERLSRAI